jgi:hypothetical protein
VPADSEYPIAGALNGDQMSPALSVDSHGGHVVWHDNAIDGGGYGIGAARLGPDFTPLIQGFRVNQIVPGNQEAPQVARLINGGTVFVWQGVPDIYARFVSPDGWFLTEDVKVSNSSAIATNVIVTNWVAYRDGIITNCPFTFQEVVTQARGAAQDPAVIVLRDGNVILAYTCTRKTWTTTGGLVTGYKKLGTSQVLHSYLQTNSTFLDSMQDVFVRRFSPTGQKSGRDTVANNSLSYHQRDPALAALNNGNFVAVWVSEQQVATTPSQPTIVDIRGRLFDPQCRPLGSEFRVNPVRGLCGEPAVSSLGADGFTVVWSQFDLTGTNGWDVFGRVFSAAGGGTPQPTTSAFMVNSFQRSRQTAPKIATLGVNQLVVWTSLGQDGSYEGVFGRFLSQGALAGPETQVNTRTVSRQIQPCVASDGSERFVVAWSSFVSGRTGFDLRAQTYLTTQPPSALPAPVVTVAGTDSLQANWSAAPYGNVLNYEVYLDGASSPVVVTNPVWLAKGLAPGSTHEFRVRFVLTNGQRSSLSPPGVGTTLTEAQLAGGQSNNTTGEQTDGSVVGSGGESGGALRLGINVTPLGRRLHWNTQPGGVYQVQCSTNLALWSDVDGSRSAGALGDSLDVTNNQGAAFFRVIRLR